MTLKMRAVAVVFVALAISSIAMAACGGQTTTSIIQTTQAEERATRNAGTQATTENTGDQLSAQERVRATAAARATEAAASGAATATPQGSGNELPYGDITAADIEGDPISGEAEVQIGNNGVFSPEMLKVTAGTNVTWSNSQRTASSTKSFPDQDEQWDSGSLSRGGTLFEPVPGTFSYTFENPGCFQYRSDQSGQDATGVVCVVE